MTRETELETIAQFIRDHGIERKKKAPRPHEPERWHFENPHIEQLDEPGCFRVMKTRTL